MDMINLTIDNVPVQVPAGTSVLEAALAAGIRIPTLCYLKDVSSVGACRLCLVDSGARSFQASCVLAAAEGMNVKTNTPALREARKINLELLLSNHDQKCLSCVRSGNCELKTLCEELGVKQTEEFTGEKTQYTVDELSPSVVRDPNKCVLCRRCVAACKEIQNIGVIGATGRGFTTIIESPWDLKLAETACINCGQCIAACPVGALTEKDNTADVFAALDNPELHVVVQPAPAVRVAIGEEFGMPMGTRVTGKLATALKRMGFDGVFDTNFGADLTIMEEASELIDRVQNNGVLPMITSCSPGWVKYCEHFYPEFIPNLSTCKSPHQMLGAVTKSYYAKMKGIDPKKIVTVSVMPCTAKKYEGKRPEMEHDGLRDVDYVITTRELARMIKALGIDFVNLPDGQFDDVLGDSTGAAAIFGATGGVMEAALRTAYEFITSQTLENVNFTEVRGISGVKEATIKVGDMDVNVAVANGTGNAAKLLDSVKSGEKNYHFIEIMACPGGCVTGGGQPIVTSQTRMTVDPRVVRAKAIYDEDEALQLRKSHDNPSIKKLYEEYLGKPGGEKSHHLLHTHYSQKPIYQDPSEA